jgi:hypothetical protein
MFVLFSSLQILHVSIRATFCMDDKKVINLTCTVWFLDLEQFVFAAVGRRRWSKKEKNQTEWRALQACDLKARGLKAQYCCQMINARINCVF